MSASKVNVDLQQERDEVKFNLKELTTWFYGGAENVKERKYFGKFQKFSYQIIESGAPTRKCHFQ